MEFRGNNFVDHVAKRAAQETDKGKVLYTSSQGDENEEVLIRSEKEQDEIQKHGAVKDNLGRWKMPDGRQVLNKTLTKKIFKNIHALTHWGTLCDHFMWSYVCIGAFEIARTITKQCMICQ